jgi:hypothetical protein
MGASRIESTIFSIFDSAEFRFDSTPRKYTFRLDFDSYTICFDSTLRFDFHSIPVPDS